MAKVPVILSVALLLGALALSCNGRICNAGDTQACGCPAGQAGSQVCKVDGSGFEDCVCMTMCELYAAALSTCYDGLCDSMTGCAPCDYYKSLSKGPDGEPGGADEQAECKIYMESFDCAFARNAVAPCTK